MSSPANPIREATSAPVTNVGTPLNNNSELRFLRTTESKSSSSSSANMLNNSRTAPYIGTPCAPAISREVPKTPASSLRATLRSSFDRPLVAALNDCNIV